MKIDDSNLTRTGGISAKKTEASGSSKKGTDKASSSETHSGDRVEVSESNASIGLFKSILNSLSDIRVKHVEGIKTQVEAGQYHREAMDIAEAILNEASKYGR